MKICFVRVDRIGDFLLTVPLNNFYKSGNLSFDISWLISEGVEFLAKNLNPPIKYKAIAIASKFFDQLKSAFKIKSWAREQNFDKVIIFHGPWWIALGFFMARTPFRIGVASQWFSWIFYNSKLRQKRSLGEKHELEYNYDLARFALGGEGQIKMKNIRPTLKISETQFSKWQKLTKSWGEYAVLHPGMLGSARNLKPENYKKLAEMIRADGINLVVTGGPGDLNFLDKTEILKLPDVINMVGKTPGEEILGLLSFAKTVIAPSTGVIHIAAALGVPAIGIYSPVRVQAPKRWGPLGERSSVFKPEVDCPGLLSCLGKECPIFDCMDKISLKSIADSVRTNLTGLK